MKSARLNAFAVSAVLATAAACAGGEGHGVNGDGATDADPVATCALTKNLPELLLPTSEVTGVLKGSSLNPSTTCTPQKGTGGPDTFYALRLTERSIIELQVESAIDTVVAVRKACDDPLTEVACNDVPPDPTESDGPTGVAGTMGGTTPIGGDVVAGPTSEEQDGFVRATLEPGIYYVLIDQAAPNGVGGPFALKVRRFAPPANAACTTATTLTDGTNLTNQDLDTAIEPARSCSGGASRPALYYRATIPAGQSLMAHAEPLNGTVSWTPVLQVLSACENATCLATAQAPVNRQSDRMIRYTNTSASPMDVLLSLGSSVAVGRATFNLLVHVGDPASNVTCESARVLTDGLILRGQDMSLGQPSTDIQCKGSGQHPSLFYKAVIGESQTLRVTFAQQSQTPFLIILHEGCGNAQCMASDDRSGVTYANRGPGPKTVILEITSFNARPPVSFDMTVSITATPDPIGDSVLVWFGSEWKYLDDGVDPGQKWRELAFDDSAWKEGPSRLGFDTTVETPTVTNDNGGPPTSLLALYLRHTFNLNDPSKIKALNLEMILDDGAVIYLNGKEIARDNLPPGELTSSDVAIEDHLSGTSTETDINYNWDGNFVPAPPLLKGKNVLAVEIHNASQNSDDLGFDMQVSIVP